MTTVKLKGPGVGNYFARKMVEDLGAEEAKKRTCGPMLKAVEQVIAQQEAVANALPSESSEQRLNRLIDAANGVLFLFPSGDYPDATIGGMALKDLETALVLAGGTPRRPRPDNSNNS